MIDILDRDGKPVNFAECDWGFWIGDINGWTLEYKLCHAHGHGHLVRAWALQLPDTAQGD